MVNVNWKIDDVYTELNEKFETLTTHVKKFETQVVQTWEAVKKQETFIKGKGDEALKYHVNAIIEDDFWQVVKEEKLQEGDIWASTVHIGVDWLQERNIDRWD